MTPATTGCSRWSTRGGTVWGELTTAIQPAGDTKVRAGGAWFQVRPHLGSGGITGASIVRQGYLAAKGQYEIYPAVQPDAAGNAAVILTLTSSSRYPSAAHATLRASGSHFGPAVVAAGGRGHYGKTATRWGDYSFAVPDSSAHTAWLATEFIPPKSGHTTTGLANWGTRVLEVPLPDGPPMPVPSPRWRLAGPSPAKLRRTGSGPR